MTDRLCRGLFPSRGLRAVFLTEPELADIRRRLLERERASGSS